MTARKGARTRGILASVGLAAVASLAFAGVAAAAVGPDQPGHPDSGTLTINKYKGGYTATPSDDDLLDGVEFIVQRVGKLDGTTCKPIDLTTPGGWELVKDFIPAGENEIHTAAPADPYCLVGTAITQETEDGTAEFKDLPLGLYFVKEGADNGNNNIVDPVQPFYVTIPLAVKGGTAEAPTYTWEYDVVVNPKNATSEAPNKQVTDPQPEGQWVLGSQVEWTITNTIPLLNEGSFTEISVTDPLDERLSYVKESTEFTVGDIVLSLSTDGVNGDYTLGTVDPNTLVWTLTESGLKKAFTQQGKELKVVFKTTIESLTPNGVVPNKATVSFNNKPQDTPEPITFWGGFKFLKVDESNSGKTLAGAEFAVIEKGAGDCPATLPEDAVIRGTATSNAAGVVTFPGLWISNWNPPAGDDNPQVKTRDYCLYETKAPAGYEIPAGTFPKVVTVEAEAPDGTVDIGSVKNPQVKPPTLPQTGANGTLLMTIGGIAIVAAGLGAALVARNRRQSQDA